MAETFPSYKKYLSDYRTFERDPAVDGPSWLRDVRRQGLASFDRLGFPTATRGNERWKYTNVSPIAKSEFEYPLDAKPDGVSARRLKAVAPWDDSWTRLVFVDGGFSPGLSTSADQEHGVQVENLAGAVRENGALVEKHLGRYATVDDDGFAAINTAFLRDGAVVHVPEGASPASALHLLFVTTKRSQPIVTYPRMLIVAGRHSKLTVVESYVGLSDTSYLTNAVAEIVVEEGAEIEHYRYLAESPNAFHVGTTRVRLERDSTFSSVSFATGARLARNDLYVLLDAPGSACRVDGLYATSGNRHIDNHIDIDHAQPHTSSDQYFKGILADDSRAVFSGRVLVRKNAQKTYARQADKNLILSEGARVNTKPSLEIFADDVQCFHGATAGAVAEDALFYMRTRGLDEEKAKRILIRGFASEIIERVRLGPLRRRLDRLFSGDWPGGPVAGGRRHPRARETGEKDV